MKKTVLITGGAGGIGAACARRLAGEYNLIIACNKSRERALELQRELSQLCDCTVACGDITDSAFVRSLFALRADAVINNAGVSSFALALKKDFISAVFAKRKYQARPRPLNWRRSWGKIVI